MGVKIISESHLCLRIKSLVSTRSFLGTFFLKPLSFFPLNCLGSICVQLSNSLRTEFLDFYFLSVQVVHQQIGFYSSLLCNTLLKAESKCQYTLSLTLQSLIGGHRPNRHLLQVLASPIVFPQYTGSPGFPLVKYIFCCPLPDL